MSDLPGATTANASAAAQAGGAATTPAAVALPDLASMKLEGDKIPEKFRGKTLPEVLASIKDLESSKTTAEQKVSQWNEWYRKEVLNKARAADEGDGGDGSSRGSSKDPRAAFEAHQVQALSELFDSAMAPIVNALSGIYKENVKTSRPDFDQFEGRAKEIFEQMPYTHKVDPAYGWNFAYNMARAEKMGKDPAPPPNTVAGGSGGAPTAANEPEKLTPVEQLWAKRFKMSDEDYRKYGTPKED
jgi:hypothetical protein